MSKKTVLIHSNFVRAFTGFGKNKKNIMRYLFDTGKYNLVELANGLHWSDPQTETVPWTCRGSLPSQSDLQKMNADEQRAASYGGRLVDKAVQEFKPDVYIGIEDIWGFGDYHMKPWWDKINTMVWTTLDSLPILPQAIDFAPKVKHYYVWASFAERAMKDLGYNHVKTLRGSLDTSIFHRLDDTERVKLRQKFQLSDEFIVGFVFRNQLRKSVPNLLDGFKKFKETRPNCKLLLHTHWGEGWDIPRLLEEKKIDQSSVITTYVCNQCGNYDIRPFSGQEQNCKYCGAEKSLNTTNTAKGVTDGQLNEIYNLMDVYCHPFTSGGQEIPIQEAKLTELITLVTNYSCGEDSCTPDSGGLSLDWSEYREPGTQFIKASTLSSDIATKLNRVYDMASSLKRKREKMSRQWVIDNFSIEVIGKQLEKIIDSMPEIDYNFDFNDKIEYDSTYEPQGNFDSEADFIIDLYKNILKDKVDKNSQGVKHWINHIKNGVPAQDVVKHFQGVAQKQINNSQVLELSDILDKEDAGKRIAVVIPHFETDVLMINSLLKNLKKQYKKYNIYVFTKPEYFCFIDDNPFAHKVMHYSPLLENLFTMEGAGDHEGLFEMAFYPHTTTQKNISFLHNGLDKLQFNI
jgi:glycosyltransferase involved in cell wall biosynthesis|tara:strand:+ start:176 stop:2065 length:1890 start_codon:yes stop_codon:yes gene_type:complete